MACLRLTLIEPAPGNEREAQRVMEALDGCLAQAPGLILSFVTKVEGYRMGRISLWHSKEDANQVALRDDILALRSQLRRLSVNTEETLMDLKSGHVPEQLAAQLAGAVDIEPIATTMDAVA
jgi:hypothetical protein